jgi:hypothetical protein
LQLLQRKPINRLGLKGPTEVKDHPWIKSYNWKDLAEKKMESPFIPRVGDNFDRKYCEGIDKIGPDTRERYDNYIRDDDFHIKFRNFTYCTTHLEPTPKRNKLYEPKTSRAPSGSSYSGKGLSTNSTPVLPKTKPNAHSQSNYNVLYNNIVADLKKSRERDRSLNNFSTVKQTFFVDRHESGITSYRSSSIKHSVKSPNPPDRLDSARIKKLINSGSTNSMFKGFKNPLVSAAVGKKSSTSSLSSSMMYKKVDKNSTKSSFMK